MFNFLEKGFQKKGSKKGSYRTATCFSMGAFLEPFFENSAFF